MELKECVNTMAERISKASDDIKQIAKDHGLQDIAAAIAKQIDAIEADVTLTQSQKVVKLGKLKSAQRVNGSMKLKEMLLDAKARHDLSLSILETPRFQTAYSTPYKRAHAQSLSLIEGTEAYGNSLANKVSHTSTLVNNKIVHPLQKQLTEIGALEYAADAGFNLRVARALYTNVADVAGDSLTPIVNGTRDIIRKSQIKMRGVMLEAGLSVAEDKSRIVKLMHDGIEIGKGSFEEWEKVMLSEMDINKSFAHLFDEGNTAAKNMDIVKEELKGYYDKFTRTANGQFGSSLSNSAISKSRRLEKGRTFHWKSADSFMTYFNKYGSGDNLIHSTLAEFKRTAKDVAVIEHLGPTSVSNMRSIVDSIGLANGLGTAEIKALQKVTQQSYSTLTGHLMDGYTAGSQKVAAIGGTARGFESMSKLGASGLTTVLDLPTTAMNYKTVSGTNLFQATAESMFEVFHAIAPKAQKQFAQDTLLMLDEMNKEIVKQISESSGSYRGMSKMLDFFHTATGLNYMTKIFKVANGNLMLKNLNDVIQNGARTTEHINMLNRFQISPDDLATMKALDTFVTPKILDDLKVHDKLGGKLHSMLVTGMKHGSPTPDTRTLRQMGHYIPRGTGKGEAVRFAGQFKSTIWKVTTDINERSRMVSKSGTATLVDAKAASNLTQFIMFSTAMGMVRNELKDRISTLDFTSPIEMTPDKFLEGLRSGGGGGITFDFAVPILNPDLHPLVAKGALFGTAAGPIPDTMLTLGLKVRDVVYGKKGGVDKLGKEMWRNVPFNNVVYLKWLNDRFFEAMDQTHMIDQK